MWQEYSRLDNQLLTEFTTESLTDLQNYYLKKIIRHTHTLMPANYIKISEAGEIEPPVGLSTPSDDSVLTWQDHVNIPHSKSLVGGRLLARGYTVPIRSRFIITTPIMDTTSNLPFPTYNMSSIGINKDISSSELLDIIQPNRHDYDSYSIYRHYLWLFPSNNVCQLHPAHKLLVDGDVGTVVFTHQPIYIHPSNTEFLKKISNSINTPNFRSLTYIPDYTEEKIWSVIDDSTCILSGYKTILTNNNKNIMLFFNDYYNEFNQFLSILNYEEQYREYIFRLEKAPGNLTRLEHNDLSDITKLMEAKKIDVLDAPEHGEIIKDSINKKYSPFYLSEYNFKIDKLSDRLKDSLLESCVQKTGKDITIYPKGLDNYLYSVGDYSYSYKMNIPDHFDNGYRQCLVLTGELGTSSRSFKMLHKGRIMAIYQIIDGYVSVPYEIYSNINKLTGAEDNQTKFGSSINKNITDVTKMESTETLCF
jgi:hypothetical protein